MQDLFENIAIFSNISYENFCKILPGFVW